MKLLSCWAFLFFFVSISQAATADNIQKLVADYDRLQVFKMVMGGQQSPRPLPDEPNQPHPRPIPPDGCGGGAPPSRDCMEAVCNHLGAFGCKQQDEITQVARMCRNVSGTCVNGMCNKVSRFDCNDMGAMQAVTNMCRGLFDFSCVEYVCSRLSYFDCNELDKLRKVADQCR